MRHPVHVTLRLKDRIRMSLRNGKSYKALRAVLLVMLDQPGFRIIHVSIQKNHLHLLIEAKDKRALTDGMHRFGLNAARAINATISGSGKVFKFRYHATQIKTTWHARSALAYVINNWRRHRADLESAITMKASVDPYASGLSHPAWAARFTAVPAYYEPLPVSQPRTWLLREGYKRHGEVDPWETPAAWEHTWRI